MGRRSHAKHAEARARYGCVGRSGKTQREQVPGLRGIDDAVVPQPRSRVVWVALCVELAAGWLLECLLVVSAPSLTLGRESIAAHGGEHRRGLIAAHHRDARVRPSPEETR